ncbi:MAG: hypothetical protein HY353_03910 [Candidatus Omnitrophica bacterium]|nr:hypothetical protein [Candidatus Omnitrophota bacterium]
MTASGLNRLATFGGILLVDATAIVAAAAVGDPPTELFEEYRVMTYFSGAQILLIALLCWRIFQVRRRTSWHAGVTEPAWLWALFAAGAVFLALDEVLQVHENLDFTIHRLLGIQETNLTDRIDDAIVGLYGVVASAALALHRKKLRWCKPVASWAILGVLGIFGTALLDALTNRNDVLPYLLANPAAAGWLRGRLMLLEDAVKILAEGIFLGSAYVCLRIAKGAASSGEGHAAESNQHGC